MRTGIFLSYADGFREAVDDVVELEKVGVDIALVAEAYSYDAVSQLGYLAAKTSTIELGSGVVPIYIRTPSLLAMTAAGLDYVSDGRFRLGIGTSGPQVMEGFHGVRKTADTVEEKLELVAARAGFVVLPRSTTAFYRRADVRVVPVEDLGPSRVTLIWDAAKANPLRDEFVAAALACRDQTI